MSQKMYFPYTIQKATRKCSPQNKGVNEEKAEHVVEETGTPVNRKGWALIPQSGGDLR